MDDYLEVIQEGDNLEDVQAIGEAILEVTSVILENPSSDETSDEIYALVEELEAAVLCNLACGEEPVILNVCDFFISLFKNHS